MAAEIALAVFFSDVECVPSQLDVAGSATAVIGPPWKFARSPTSPSLPSWSGKRTVAVDGTTAPMGHGDLVQEAMRVLDKDEFGYN